MAKKIKFESFKYRFLIAAQETSRRIGGAQRRAWEEFVAALELRYEKGSARIEWHAPHPGTMLIALGDVQLYQRGDNEEYVARQKDSGMPEGEDPIKLKNLAYFDHLVGRVAHMAGFHVGAAEPVQSEDRLAVEREFHDAWANSEIVENIDVRMVNEACTSPEMRYITRRLGDVRDKRLLDVGCGLGEASVYFALLGAQVTSADLSQGMLDATSRLAAANRVSIAPHLAAAEDMGLPHDARFDVIYAGNLLHHVDIEQTLSRLKPHLAPDGLLVTWDPLAYNPAINVYRSIASGVRTPDEHPLTWNDIKLFRRNFDSVETRYFWLTTLIIFVIMALAQRRNPNKERYWKVVVQEGEKWRWLYEPLEWLDGVLLRICPPLRMLCWNVVVVAFNHPDE